MSSDNQIEIPQSFIALFMKPGQQRPTAPEHVVIARYEQCEDMATVLTEHAHTLVFKENLSEAEVLSRCHAGLLAAESDFSASEATWVIARLAELLGWPAPAAGAV